MKKIVFIIAMLGFSLAVFSQKARTKQTAEIKVPMAADRWSFAASSTEFVNYKNMMALKILKSGEKIVLRDQLFTDGTIEFDIEPHDEAFAGVFFRMVDNSETEYFYLRVARAGNLSAMDAVQYAAFVKGVNLWDLLDHYQGPAEFSKDAWNHIKLVVSGKQMLVYVNDMTRAALQIPHLEANTTEGKIAFTGRCVIANLVIKPGEVDGLPAREGFDPTHHDPRYVRSWQISEPLPLPRGRELFEGDFPKPGALWQDIKAERRGLINLTRVYGASSTRRYVWLRTKLVSDSDQRRRFSVGFSDEIWVYVNMQPVFVDKNIYANSQMRKIPDGRISIENAQFDVNLKAGENEILIGVANDFFGWGLVARLDKMDGIQVNNNFPPPIEQPKDLNRFTGTYGNAEVADKITISAVNDVLMGQSTGSQPIALEYFEKDKFKFEQAGLVLEFYPEEKKLVVRQGGKETVFLKQ